MGWIEITPSLPPGGLLHGSEKFTGKGTHVISWKTRKRAMSSIQVFLSKHEVIQFARDLVQYRELMRGGGGRGCKIEEAICISSMGHVGIRLLRGDTDFALTRLLAGPVRGMPVYWEGLCV